MWRFPLDPSPPYLYSWLSYQHPLETGTFATADEAVVTHTHPKSTVYLRVHCGVVQSMVWTRITTYIHHYCILQNIFTALKILCSAHPSLPTTRINHYSFSSLHCFAFFRISYHTVGIRICILFHI